MNVWLIKPEGLYDTFETADLDLSEYFEEVEEECVSTSSYQGYSFRRVQH